MKLKWGCQGKPQSDQAGGLIGRGDTAADTMEGTPDEDTGSKQHLDLRRGASGETALPIPWSWTSNFQNCEKMNFCQVSYQVCRTWSWQPWQTTAAIFHPCVDIIGQVPGKETKNLKFTSLPLPRPRSLSVKQAEKILCNIVEVLANSHKGLKPIPPLRTPSFRNNLDFIPFPSPCSFKAHEACPAPVLNQRYT